MSLLEVEDVVVRYGHAVAVDGVSLRLDERERVALIGPNGAGKTSLLHALLGLVKTAGGRVRMNGQDVTHHGPSRRVRLGASLVPEGRQVFPSLTVESNLLLGAFGRLFRREIVSATLAYLASRNEVRQRLENVYELLPQLYELRDRPAGRTSGGEQQMVAVGRALMSDPQLLLVDELSLGLAPSVVEVLTDFLRQLNEERGVALLLVEQNAHLAFDLCPRAYVLETGRCELEGASDSLRRNPTVQAAYLGAEEAVEAG